MMHTTDTNAGENIASELESPAWAVVTNLGLVVSGLTYPEASRKIKQLDSAPSHSGLCIVTEEVAARLSN